MVEELVIQTVFPRGTSKEIKEGTLSIDSQTLQKHPRTAQLGAAEINLLEHHHPSPWNAGIPQLLGALRAARGAGRGGGEAGRLK